MLTGRIRSAQTITEKVEGDSLADIRSKLAARTPKGFELVSAPVTQRKGSITIDAVGTFASRGEVREIEGVDLAGIRAAVPDGWELLSLRAS